MSIVYRKEEPYFSKWHFPHTPLINKDMPTFMARQLAFKPEHLKEADVAILGTPYPFGPGWAEWLEAIKRVRIESLRYPSYVQEADIDIFDYLNVVDYGDVKMHPEINENFTSETMLESLWNTQEKVGDIIDAGAVPITLGGSSCCTAYGVVKPLSDRTKGKIGVISLDAHGDNDDLDDLTGDPRVPGSGSWQSRMHELPNIDTTKQVEIGQRGQSRHQVEKYKKEGIHHYSMWKVKQMGIEKLCKELKYAYEETECVYLHFDVDILGGEKSSWLCRPMGMSDYEALRLMFEIGKMGVAGISFVAIPPESFSVHRLVVYAIRMLLAGKALSKQ